jgi:uncharacterized protein (TIGR03382 family)
MDPDSSTLYGLTGEGFNGLVVLLLVWLGRRRRDDDAPSSTKAPVGGPGEETPDDPNPPPEASSSDADGDRDVPDSAAQPEDDTDVMGDEDGEETEPQSLV